MSTLIAQSADLHLGFRQYGYERREADFYTAAERVFQTAIRNKAQALILAGDQFDSAKPPAVAVWALQQLVGMAKKAGIRVLGIDGNHDACDGHWLKVCGIEPLGEIPTIVGEARVVGINATRSSELERTLDRMIAANTRADILVIHQAVAELADFQTDITAAALAPKLRQLGVRYCAMGDIHNYRETVIDDVRFCYPGCPEMKAIDEAPDKGMNLVEVSPTVLKTTMLRLETRPFRTYRLDTEADLDKVTLDCRAAPQPLLVLCYAPEHRELAQRAEELLKRADMMYRLYPLASGQSDLKEQMVRQGFERRGALGRLKDAVTAYFDETTDEAQLVMQLLDNPDGVKEIVQQYMKSKGLE